MELVRQCEAASGYKKERAQSVACFRPLTGYKSKTINPSGKRSIVFDVREGFVDQPVTLPCGQCRFCRLEHSRQWAIRALHESQLYKYNCFLTLTYDDEHVPKNGSLDYNAPVLFMKRLRDKFGSDIRSYGCAEYGEKYQRPHYHLCVFNHDFTDKKEWKVTNGIKIYRSSMLERLWPFGHSSVGDLTFESAAYVARYVTKKLTGPRARAYDLELDVDSGEIPRLLPERAVCVSRRPGLGREWYRRYGDFVRNHDYVIIRGQKVRPAKYYDRLFDIEYPEQLRQTKQLRKEQAKLANKKLDDIDLEAIHKWEEKQKQNPNQLQQIPIPRLTIIENTQELKYNQLKRGYENGKN